MATTTSQLLGRLLDPTDPESSLRQEIGDGGLEHLLTEARRWLKPGETEPEELEADLAELVERIVTAAPVSTRPLTRGDLAQNLRRAMGDTSAAALARDSGVHRNTISNILAADKSPSVDILAAIATALTIPASSLLETTMTWTIDLADDFATTPQGNTVSIIVDPVERSVDDYHVSIGGNSWPGSVHNKLKCMVPVPRGAIGSEVAKVLTARVDLLDAIADEYQGSHWDGSNERGRWGDELMGLLSELAQALKGVRRYWDALEWLDWECANGRVSFAAYVANAIVDAGDFERGLDESLVEFRTEGAIATEEAADALRDFLKRIADEDLETELDDAREEAEPDEDGERDEDAIAQVERVSAQVSVIRRALEI